MGLVQSCTDPGGASRHHLGWDGEEVDPRARLAVSYPAISLTTATAGPIGAHKSAWKPPPTSNLPEFKPPSSRL